MVDLPASFKKYEYDDWYKSNFDTSNGIWIGPGVGQQFVIKVTTQLSSYSNITKEYGVFVKNGAASIIKLINEIK